MTEEDAALKIEAVARGRKDREKVAQMREKRDQEKERESKTRKETGKNEKTKQDARRIRLLLRASTQRTSLLACLNLVSERAPFFFQVFLHFVEIFRPLSLFGRLFFALFFLPRTARFSDYRSS